jgi:hypothetical protein
MAWQARILGLWTLERPGQAFQRWSVGTSGAIGLAAKFLLDQQLSESLSQGGY